MTFALTAEHEALAAMAGDVFAKWFSPPRLRELWDGGDRDSGAWRAMAEVGLVGIAVPEEQGGSGGDMIDVMIVAEQAGRACVPEPLIETTAVAVPVLTDSAAADWLPRIAAGEAVVALQMQGQPYASHADIADLLLVEVDGRMHAVGRAGFSAEPVPSEDPTRRLCRVTVTDAGKAVADADVARQHGTVAAAALLNGVGLALLEMTLAYTKVREQFGVPVGSFQAVKHKLASVHTALESSRAAVRYAAYATARGLPDQRYAANAAAALAIDAQALANTEALQCHAGIGFTWEHDLHFWLKRGRALEHAWGSASGHRAALAAALLDHDGGGDGVA